jgi:hypothetical protein
MKIEHLLVDSTITEKRRGNWNKQASYDAGQKGKAGIEAGKLAAADQRNNELPDTKLTARQELIRQKSADNYKNLARRDAAASQAEAPPEAAPPEATPKAQASAEAPPEATPKDPVDDIKNLAGITSPNGSAEAPADNGSSNALTTTQQQGSDTVNLTATPADNGSSNALTTTQQQGPEEEKPSGWERAKRFGAQAVDAAGSIGRGAKAVGGAVGDVATGLGHVAGGVGNLAARTTGGIAQTIGAIGGGLKAGFKGQDYKHGGSSGSSYSGPDQWGNTSGGGGSSGTGPDEVDDLRATIRSMDQRLRRAGI